MSIVTLRERISRKTHFSFSKIEKENFFNFFKNKIEMIPKNHSETAIERQLLLLFANYIKLNPHLFSNLKEISFELEEKKKSLQGIFLLLKELFEIESYFPNENLKDYFLNLLLKNFKNYQRKIASCFVILVSIYNEDLKDPLKEILFSKEIEFNDSDLLELLIQFREKNGISIENFKNLFFSLLENFKKSDEEEVRITILDFFLTIIESSQLTNEIYFDSKMLEM